ncbi:sensor histidine kinase [Plantactinospora sp. KLBMP9567]|uniref:sensor histidine kinase n=1 Tax=Plantactinospora sp. KLBMP9567 TaxID=3085900 RepID=UPI00298225BD|nr:histidine kinase [Plantactinospora sp. KLBMP9567]MDW5324764.1 histidine kinase [Plantactinospora sp. KLBMP9567]
MASPPDPPGRDPRLRRPRIATLVALVSTLLTALMMPGIGLAREPDPVWTVLGSVGIVAVATAQIVALYVLLTPWLTTSARRRALAGYAGTAVASVPLVGPVAGGHWPTWAWLGASIVGTAPLLLGRRTATLVVAATVAVSVVVARSTGGEVADHLLITGGIGLSVAGIGWFQVWFWDLLVQAQQGRSAQARLAATQERLRFARDVHDLLGHHLSVIALKAELAARLASVDPERAGREAAEVQRLAVSALAEVREAVHGYRAVDLREQLAATAEVLRSSGVRCTVEQPTGEVPAEVAAQLAPVLREASTNLLRHSRATWCRIEVGWYADRFRLTVANDGAGPAAPDRHSSGLRGLADRLADADGTLRTEHRDGVFTVEAVVPAPDTPDAAERGRA